MLASPRLWPWARPKALSQDFTLYPTGEVPSSVCMQPTGMAKRWRRSFLPVLFTCTSSTLLLFTLRGSGAGSWGALQGSELEHKGVEGATCVPSPARLG